MCSEVALLDELPSFEDEQLLPNEQHLLLVLLVCNVEELLLRSKVALLEELPSIEKELLLPD